MTQSAKYANKQRLPLWRWLLPILLLMLVCAGVWWFGSVRITLNPQGTHTQALTRWTIANLTAYEMTVIVVEPLRENAVYELVVENGSITQAATMNPGTFRFDANPPRYEIDPVFATAYTIDSLFGRTERLIRNFNIIHIYTPGTSQVHYHPGLGYPTDLTNNTCGIFAADIDACITHIQVVRLEPFTPDS